MSNVKTSGVLFLLTSSVLLCECQHSVSTALRAGRPCTHSTAVRSSLLEQPKNNYARLKCLWLFTWFHFHSLFPILHKPCGFICEGEASNCRTGRCTVPLPLPSPLLSNVFTVNLSTNSFLSDPLTCNRHSTTITCK